MKEKQVNKGFSNYCIIANSGFTVINFRSELIEHLVKSGNKVCVVCPADCPLMHGRDTRKELAALGASFIPIKLNRSGTNPISDLFLMFSLWKILFAKKPDVVLNYTIKASIYGSLAAFFAGVGFITSNITGIGSILSGDTLKSRLMSVLLRVQYKIALAVNGVVFFQNPDDKAYFVSKNLVKEKYTKIINGSGVDIEKFKRHNFDPEPNTFIFIGRFLKDKGVVEFVEAAKLLRTKFPQAKFTLLGSTDNNPQSLSIKDIKGYRDLGILNYWPAVGDVRPALEEHAVFVLPSYREGTPRSVLEAMSMSMPIVTTDAPGCRETVDHARNGFLVKVKNVPELATAMEEFILDPSLVKSMGLESRNIVCEKYDVRNVNASILAAITENQ